MPPPETMTGRHQRSYSLDTTTCSPKPPQPVNHDLEHLSCGVAEKQQQPRSPQCLPQYPPVIRPATALIRPADEQLAYSHYYYGAHRPPPQLQYYSHYPAYAPRPPYMRQHRPEQSAAPETVRRASHDVAMMQARHEAVSVYSGNSNAYWPSDSSPDSLNTTNTNPMSLAGAERPSDRTPSASRDLEKEFLEPSPVSSHASMHQVHKYTTDDDDDESVSAEPHQDKKTVRNKTLKALVNMATLLPFAALAVFLLTLLISISAPVLFVVKTLSKSDQTSLRHRLTPCFMALMHCTSAAPPPDLVPGVLPPGFVLWAVLVLSPVIAFPLTLASWVVALFWAFNAMIQDEGNGKGDGHSMACALVSCWALWLRGRFFGCTCPPYSSLKPRSRPSAV